jgi:hypothetical protein
MLKAKPSLGLDKPSLCRLANRTRYRVLRLAAEGVAGVLHAMFQSVTLNALDGAIPSLGLGRIGGPLP